MIFFLCACLSAYLLYEPFFLCSLSVTVISYNVAHLEHRVTSLVHPLMGSQGPTGHLQRGHCLLSYVCLILYNIHELQGYAKGKHWTRMLQGTCVPLISS